MNFQNIQSPFSIRRANSYLKERKYKNKIKTKNHNKQLNDYLIELSQTGLKKNQAENWTSQKQITSIFTNDSINCFINVIHNRSRNSWSCLRYSVWHRHVLVDMTVISLTPVPTDSFHYLLKQDRTANNVFQVSNKDKPCDQNGLGEEEQDLTNPYDL